MWKFCNYYFFLWLFGGLVTTNGYVLVTTHLRTSLGAVHDGVAAVDREGVTQSLEALLGVLVAGVDDPAVGLHQHGRAEVLVSVPPV